MGSAIVERGGENPSVWKRVSASWMSPVVMPGSTSTLVPSGRVSHCPVASVIAAGMMNGSTMLLPYHPRTLFVTHDSSGTPGRAVPVVVRRQLDLVALEHHRALLGGQRREDGDAARHRVAHDPLERLLDLQHRRVRQDGRDAACRDRVGGGGQLHAAAEGAGDELDARRRAATATAGRRRGQGGGEGRDPGATDLALHPVGPVRAGDRRPLEGGLEHGVAERAQRAEQAPAVPRSATSGGAKV